MDKAYPFTSPQILTDAIYLAYGGVTGTSTALQRTAAYFTAEMWMSTAMGTPVVIATITGTYFYPQEGGTVQLDWMYLQNVTEIQFLDAKGTNYYTITGLANYDAAIRNRQRSIIDIFSIYGNCQGCGATYSPYLYQIVYTAGLPTGTYTAPNFLLALTEAAKMVVNEIMGYGNESVGGVGIESFRNQEYYEKRVALLTTEFGSSPKAQWIMQLVNNVRRRKGLKF